MIKVGVGKSQEKDSYQAGALACQEAFADTNSEADFLIVFASSVFDQSQMLSGVRSVGKDTPLIGCTTAGEITNEGPAKDHSVVVMATKSDSLKFYPGVGENIKDSPRKAGQTLAKNIQKQTKKLSTFFMLPDVLAGNGSDIVRGVLDVLGENFPAVGGAAGDDFKFKQTYQYLNDKIYTGAVVGAGLSGNFKWGVGVKHGWLPVGLPMIATKSEGSVLHELDNKPAISVYEDYFGPKKAQELKKDTLAKLAITYPLGIQIPQSEELLIRDPLSVDENGSITCAAEVPQGSEVRLMIGSREEAVKMAKIAAENAIKQLDKAKPKAVIIFNCIARNKLFGEHSKEEINAIQEVIGQETPLAGFYTYGEQAPINGEVKDIKKCQTSFHNETIVIFALAE